MEIKVCKIRSSARLPHRGSSYAAGYDLYADIEETTVIPPHETRMIGTGLSMAIPVGYFGGIFARSGLAAKEGMRPANCVGVVDADYRGEIMVALHNDSETDRIVESGERVAQLLLLPFIEMDFMETNQLPPTKRGDDGFGSTGKA